MQKTLMVTLKSGLISFLQSSHTKEINNIKFRNADAYDTEPFATKPLPVFSNGWQFQIIIIINI